MIEKEIEFYIDGVLNGSATIFIENGEMDITNAEEKFYKVLRADRQHLIEEEREHIIDNLTKEQEGTLQDAHAAGYRGTDDDMSDAYEGWLMDLPLDELKTLLA